ncbi:glycosyltransferase family 1 protein [Microbacterium sp. 22215]|uniref:glycosyltransferase family 1 protein n=1 Tax=Microbacterium sp. 22215 TaxID=3453893 RepID=UPI003F86C66E
MRSLLILAFSDISADARVRKQVEAFAGRFHVTTCGYGPSPQGADRHIALPEGTEVWRYSRRLLLTRRYARAYRENRAIVAARELLEPENFDVIIANDVDTVPLALSLKPAHGVHADLHEFAPSQKSEMLRWRLFVAPFFAWICRRHVTRARSVTTVAAGIAAEYRRRFGITAQVVTNATPRADLVPTPPHQPLALVHSGACFRNRHLDLMLDAVQRSTAALTLDLYLTPNDPVYLDELRQRASRTSNVRIHDAVPYEELVATLNQYDVGVFVLPPVNANYRWALPNKLFDFVQARLGVVIGPSPEMAAIVRTYGLGVVSDDFSAASLTRILDTMTAADVHAFKHAADHTALSLSAEEQQRIWVEAIDRMVESGTAS